MLVFTSETLSVDKSELRGAALRWPGVWQAALQHFWPGLRGAARGVTSPSQEAGLLATLSTAARHWARLLTAPLSEVDTGPPHSQDQGHGVRHRNEKRTLWSVTVFSG